MRSFDIPSLIYKTYKKNAKPKTGTCQPHHTTYLCLWRHRNWIKSTATTYVFLFVVRGVINSIWHENPRIHSLLILAFFFVLSVADNFFVEQFLKIILLQIYMGIRRNSRVINLLYSVRYFIIEFFFPVRYPNDVYVYFEISWDAINQLHLFGKRFIGWHYISPRNALRLAAYGLVVVLSKWRRIWFLPYNYFL